MGFFDLEFELDDHGNRVGLPVVPAECSRPSWLVLAGAYGRLEPLDAERHSADLFEAYRGHDDLWTYMPQGPFATLGEYRQWAESVQRRDDPMFFAVIDTETTRALGIASYLRIDPTARSIEVGWITYSPELQGSRAGTEAMYLMMRNAFELGYRRYEWKCNALNVESMNAAQRLGMSFDGVFPKATVVKGRNRDTAWFALVDDDWPLVRSAMEKWLEPSNFDADGRQLSALSQGSKPAVRRSWAF
jgi:RimJ/RimL family protein N-acetyltransferase